MKILVTGATGFIGGQLVKGLVQGGHQVCIFRRDQSDCSELSGLDIEHFVGDIRDLQSLKEATQGIEIVCHLAGLVGYSRAMRPLMEQINVVGTQNVIQACLTNNVQRLIHMSSVVTVGASMDKEVLDEDSEYTLSRFNLGYFETKREAERLVQRAVAENGLDAVILNPSTVYGAGDARKGSRTIQLKIARGKFPFYTSGGVSITAVEEVVGVVISAMRRGRTGERYILSGENILIKDLFIMIAKEAESTEPSIRLPKPLLYTLGFFGDFLEKRGKRVPINLENARIATMYHWFDSSKAQRELGFRPRPAEESIARSVQWMRDHLL